MWCMVWAWLGVWLPVLEIVPESLATVSYTPIPVLDREECEKMVL